MAGELKVQDIKKEGVTYSPENLGLFMSKLLLNASKKFDVNISSILDPAVGTGNLLVAVNKFFPNAFLKGIDIDFEAIKNAKKLLSKNNIKKYKLEVSNYLQDTTNISSQYSELHKPVDAIIANPPYVRKQNLSSVTRNLFKNYDISGNFDLYQAFAVEMTKQLRTDGLLCMITSNKYLSTKSGKNTRKFLRENFNIIEIIDLGDTKVFNAAVLPAIFLGQKKKNAINTKVRFKKIYEVNTQKAILCKDYKNIFEALSSIKNGKETVSINHKKNYSIEAGEMILPKNHLSNWTLSSIKDIQWVDSLKKNNITFSDVFDIHVGIKTTADKVFIRDNWENQNIMPDKKFLHPLVHSKNIKRWSTNNIILNRTILYPYEIVDGKKQVINLEKYLSTKRYFMQFYTQLSKRKYLKDAGKKWYEIWVSQNPSLMRKPKVIFPDISEKPKFSIDFNGYLVDGNCYWLSLKDGYSTDYLYLAVIVANSKIMQRFHDIEFQNKLYSGKRRYLTQYVSKYPIPNIVNSESQKLISICKKAINSSNSDLYLEKMQSKLNNLVELAFRC